MNYLFLILLLGFVLSGLIRTARLNSGYSTKWHGMMITFNVVIPLLYILNFFSFYLIAGWMLLSSGLMVSKFSLRDAIRKKKKSKVFEIRAEEKEESVERKEENKEEGLVPLPIFGD